MQTYTETESKTNVMLVESSKDGKTELSKLLAAGNTFGIGHSSCWRELEYELRDGIYDVVILHGESSAGESPFEINEKLKYMISSPPAAILFGGPDKTSAVRKAFRCGFTEVLIGEVSPRELANAVKYAAEVSNRRKNETKRIRQLERAAQYDRLTGLPNLFHFEKHVERLIESNKRRECNFSILFLNVSNIEEIIAQFGAEAADRVLLRCAERLKGSARSGETYGQFDKDTFFSVIENPVSGTEVDNAMNRLLDSLSRQIDTDAFSLKPYIDVWISEFPTDGSHLEQLLEGARTKAIAKVAETGSQNFPVSGADHEHEPVATAATAGESGKAEEGEASDHLVRNTNRRAHRRRRVLKRGALILHGGFSTIDCTIRDISDGGALILTDSSVNMPKQVELLVKESGERYFAQTRWQRDRQTGLMFVN